jgi:hypothetical protein
MERAVVDECALAWNYNGQDGSQVLGGGKHASVPLYLPQHRICCPGLNPYHSGKKLATRRLSHGKDTAG